MADLHQSRKSFMKNITRSCPLCGSGKHKLLHVQKFQEHFPHNISSCNGCGFIFVSNSPKQKFYDEYYQDVLNYEGTKQHEPHDKTTLRILLAFLKRNLKKNASFLDVGCSFGYILSIIKSHGYSNLSGLDPAPVCRKIAKEKYGLNITTSTLLNYNSRKKYDFIILSQVLEHVRDFKDDLKKINSLLNDGGYLFIGVPDLEKFHSNGKEPFGEFSLEHINFFDRKSLFTLFKDFNNEHMESDGSILVSIWKKDGGSQKRIDAYIENSKNKIKQVQSKIDSCPSEVYVWGAGALAQKMMLLTTLKKKTYKFIDLNSTKIGSKLGKFEIISPTTLKTDKTFPILLATYRYKDEILSYIKKNGIKNKIITLE